MKHILLVEDSLDDAELILSALQPHGVDREVVHVRDGAEALDYLYRRGAFADRSDVQPILMLLDLSLPKVDGLEVLREMKGDDELKMIPVVMMTSSSRDQDLIRSYDLGVNGYVVKPKTAEDLVEAVKQMTGFWTVTNEVPEGLHRGESVGTPPTSTTEKT
jgi:CheY-like chemotaxis protein